MFRFFILEKVTRKKNVISQSISFYEVSFKMILVIIIVIITIIIFIIIYI